MSQDATADALTRYVLTGTVLGAGTFGTVFEAFPLSDRSKRVAIKQVQLDKSVSGAKSLKTFTKRAFTRELRIHSSLTAHPHFRGHFTELMDYFVTTSKEGLALNMVFRLFGKSLDVYLSQKGHTFTQSTIVRLSRMLLQCLGALHDTDIMHRDIKPANTLVNDDFTELKLCDFGSAKLTTTGRHGTPHVTTQYYRAPELLFGSTRYDEQVDMWSAGCIIAELFIQAPLFSNAKGREEDQILQLITILGTPTAADFGDMELPRACRKIAMGLPKVVGIDLRHVLPGVPDMAVDLLSQLLVFSPLRRLSAEEALAHPFFATTTL